MAQRTVYLKRDGFLLFMLNALPIIIFGGICSAFLYHYGREVAIIVDFIFFICAIINGLIALKDNNRMIVFANNNISVCNAAKGAPKVLKRWVYDEIQYFYCDPKSTKIIVEFSNGKNYNVVDYSMTPMLGKAAYFTAKAELCRYYPNKVKNLRDSDVESYLQSGIITQNIKRQDESGKTGASVLFLLELILGLIPIGFGIWNAYLVFGKLSSGVSGGVVDTLNVIGK